MAKILELSKKIKDISGEMSETVTNVSGAVKSVISGYISKEDQDVSSGKGQIEINTIGQLSSWIASVHQDSPSSISLLMQAQLQALNNIETSILSGMVIDNILVCLYKSLEIADSNEEKKTIRESFAALLQSVIFVSEARLQHNIRENKEEALQMLSTAGNLISQSVNGAANIMMTMTGAGALMKGVKTAKGAAAALKCSQMVPVINNVFNPKLLELGAISHLLSAKKKQEIIDERVKDHLRMLNNLFKTLDRYSEMVGPSIQIHGMLSRYADQLIEQFVDEQNAGLKKRTARFASQMRQIMDEMNISLHQEFNSENLPRRTQRMVGAIISIREYGKKTDVWDYDEIIHIYNFLKERYSSILSQIDALKVEISAKRELVGSLGLFQQATKVALVSEINGLERKIEKLDVALSDVDEKTRVIEGMILPVKKRIDEFSSDLHSITEKYAIC